MSISVLLVDDHWMFREGLGAILAKDANVLVVGDASNGREAVQRVKELAPDVVIMDVELPELNGIEATRQITAQHAQCKVIALSMHRDRRSVDEMFQVGASGYLLKDSAPDELRVAIRAVTNGKRYISSDIADAILDGYLRSADDMPAGTRSTLTPREREVLQLIAEGKSSKDVAAALKISLSTAESYRRELMQKLDLHTTADLTRYAIREGLTPL